MWLSIIHVHSLKSKHENEIKSKLPKEKGMILVPSFSFLCTK